MARTYRKITKFGKRDDESRKYKPAVRKAVEKEARQWRQSFQDGDYDEQEYQDKKYRRVE